MIEDVFKDLKVIELAGVLAGPSAGLFFAELGAKVIKIENPKTKGDVTRSWKLVSENSSDEASAYYWSVNAGKEVLFLNLVIQEDLEKLYRLVQSADIVITNYKSGDDIKLKVDYNTLKKIQPQLIYASINGFGANSPRTAYDLILQAESGFMFMNGERGSQPVKMPVALIDILAGHQLKEAILMALLKKYKTQTGSKITVSLFDSAIASLANQATNWLIAHHLPTAQGSLHPNIAPYGELFETKDKQQITFAIGSDKQFEHLCKLLKLDYLITEPQFVNNQQRVKNRIELFKVLSKSIAIIDFNELYKQCLQHDVPIGKIRNLEDVFALEEAKQMLHTFTNDQKQLHSLKSIAFKFED